MMTSTTPILSVSLAVGYLIIFPDTRSAASRRPSSMDIPLRFPGRTARSRYRSDAPGPSGHPAAFGRPGRGLTVQGAAAARSASGLCAPGGVRRRRGACRTVCRFGKARRRPCSAAASCERRNAMSSPTTSTSPAGADRGRWSCSSTATRREARSGATIIGRDRRLESVVRRGRRAHGGGRHRIVASPNHFPNLVPAFNPILTAFMEGRNRKMADALSDADGAATSTGCRST